MDRFLKLKDFWENHGGVVDAEQGLRLKRFQWREDDNFITYIEEYVNYSSETTIWQIDKKTGKSRHCGCGAGCCWSEWE